MDNTKQAGSIVKAFLKAYGLEDKYLQYELFARWEELVGSSINNKTSKLSYSKGYLLVQVKSSTLRAELNMQRGLFKEKINQKMRGEVVRELVFK